MAAKDLALSTGVPASQRESQSLKPRETAIAVKCLQGEADRQAAPDSAKPQRAGYSQSWMAGPPGSSPGAGKPGHDEEGLGAGVSLTRPPKSWMAGTPGSSPGAGKPGHDGEVGDLTQAGRSGRPGRKHDTKTVAVGWVAMTGPRKSNPAEKAKDEARKARLAAELRANLLKRKAKPKPEQPPRDRNEGRQR